MLVIKRSQIELFIAEDDTQLHRVISDIVREAFHEEVSIHGDETIDEMVKFAISRAKSRDFEAAADVAAFVALMFEISPTFDSHEQIDAVLTDETIPKDMRIEQVLGRIPDETWAEAERTYDPEIWFPNAAD